MSKRVRKKNVASILPAATQALKASVRENAENRPGVYWFQSSTGEILYVGKAKKVRTRILSYLRKSNLGGHKGARLILEATGVSWHYFPTEFESLLGELHAIKAMRPRYNVAMKRDRRAYWFISFSEGEVPRLELVRQADPKAAMEMFGPFYERELAERAVKHVADICGLATCTMGPEQMAFRESPSAKAKGPARGCLRGDIGLCLSPCTGSGSRDEYQERVHAAREYFTGNPEAVLKIAQSAMRRAAENLAYERAAKWKQGHDELVGLTEYFAVTNKRFSAEKLSGLYCQQIPNTEQVRFYLLRRGSLRWTATAEKEENMTEFVLQVQSAVVQGAKEAPPAHDWEELRIIRQWFRKRPQERRSFIPWKALPKLTAEKISKSKQNALSMSTKEDKKTVRGGLLKK